jgi:CelD/BcsL family acetyltransferase involved in cellulose biosynthesis
MVQQVENAKEIEWRKGSFELTYSIGEIILYEKQLQGMKCVSHFEALIGRLSLDDAARVLQHYGVDAAQINSLPVTGKTAEIRLLGDAILHILSSYMHCYVNTSITFNEYQNKFSAKTRATLKRKVNKILKDGAGGNVFRKYATPSEMEQFLQLAAEISPKTYQHRLFNRGLPTNMEFVSEVLRRASAGLVRGYILFIDHRPAAYTYGPIVGEGIILYDYNGYDPVYSALSPGTVMQYKIIEDLCADPHVRMYDLCVGEDQAKQLFSTHSVSCVDIVVLKRTWRNGTLVVSHWLLKLLSKAIGRALEVCEIKQRLKKLIRSHARGIHIKVGSTDGYS